MILLYKFIQKLKTLQYNRQSPKLTPDTVKHTENKNYFESKQSLVY